MPATLTRRGSFRSPSGRRALVLATVLVLAVTAAHTAHSAPADPPATCSYVEAAGPGPAGNILEITVPESIDLEIELRREGEQIVVLDQFLSESERLTCSGGAPTVTNLDSIRLEAPATNVAPHLTINLGGGPLAPGATPEAEGESEIEITTAPPKKGRFSGPFNLDIRGQTGDDNFVLGAAKGAKKYTIDLAAELNAGERPSDPDLVVEDHHGDVFVLAGGGADRVVIAKDRSDNMPLFVEIRGQDGNDFLARGWETDGGGGDDLLKGTSEGEGLRGGAGRDRIFGYAGVDHLKGGPGGDDLFGGASRDHIVAGGGRDRVWCGSGNDDDVRADRRDRLRGCEKVFR